MTFPDRLAAVSGVLVRCARMGPRDGATCLLAWGLLHAVILRLRLQRRIPGPRTTPDAWSPGVPSPGSPAADVERLTRLFGIATGYRAAGAWCLPRALALRHLLRLHGIGGQMALGLRRGPEGLKGHAWVVYHGRVLDQDAALAGSYVRCEVS